MKLTDVKYHPRATLKFSKFKDYESGVWEWPPGVFQKEPPFYALQAGTCSAIKDAAIACAIRELEWELGIVRKDND